MTKGDSSTARPSTPRSSTRPAKRSSGWATGRRKRSSRGLRAKYVSKIAAWQQENAAKVAQAQAQAAALEAEKKAARSFEDFSLSLDEDAAEIAARNGKKGLSTTDRNDALFTKVGDTMDAMAKAQIAAIKSAKAADEDAPVNVFQTLHDYAGSSYKMLRHAGSRGWYPASGGSTTLNKANMARMDAVNDFLKKLPTLDGITYRSFGNIHEKKHLDAMLNGDYLTFKEITSSSTSAATSNRFLRANNGDGFILRIRSRNTGVPLFSERLNAAAESIGLRTDTGEQEVLMKRGSKFRVLSRTKVQSVDANGKVVQKNNGKIQFPDGRSMSISDYSGYKTNIWFIDVVEESLEAEYIPDPVTI